MVAGLATITPASGFVTIPSAVLIGLAGGIACYFAVTKLKHAFGYDDSLDVFGVHCVGSIVGMLMLGFLASAEVNPAIAGTFQKGGHAVSLAGGGAQFVNQLIAVGFTLALSAAATFVLLMIIKPLVGLRVTREAEHTGLDITEHEESAYNE
jgi:Amt family ammonium transporter